MEFNKILTTKQIGDVYELYIQNYIKNHNKKWIVISCLSIMKFKKKKVSNVVIYIVVIVYAELYVTFLLG
jgi:hypothetical protein